MNNNLKGKKISILGDSVSTYTDYSNNIKYNTTIGNNSVYYNNYKEDRHPVHMSLTLEDTWWMQVIKELDLQLCVNNSWSGSRIYDYDESAAYDKRCENLHNDITNEYPDIILIFMGTNDFSFCNVSELGNSNINYNNIMNEKILTSCNCYAKLLDKITKKYSNSIIYCMTLMPRLKSERQPTLFNNDLKNIAKHYNCNIIDLEQYGQKIYSDFQYYIEDNRVHPGKYGMDVISEAVIEELIKTNLSVINDKNEKNNF